MLSIVSLLPLLSLNAPIESTCPPSPMTLFVPVKTTCALPCPCVFAMFVMSLPEIAALLSVRFLLWVEMYSNVPAMFCVLPPKLKTAFWALRVAPLSICRIERFPNSEFETVQSTFALFEIFSVSTPVCVLNEVPETFAFVAMSIVPFSRELFVIAVKSPNFTFAVDSVPAVFSILRVYLLEKFQTIAPPLLTNASTASEPVARVSIVISKATFHAFGVAVVVRDFTVAPFALK